MKIVIIEDEDLTAADLAETIKSIDQEHEIAAILSSVSESIAFFEKEQSFDLIFSDIELGDGLSFEIFSRIEVNKPIIFCTAFDQFAIQAFETNGIAYLLKPFDKSSIEKALTKLYRIRGGESAQAPDNRRISETLLHSLKADSKSVLVYKADAIIPVPIPEIALVFKENEITYLQVGEKQMTVSQSLQILGTEFFRANRQVIIQRKYVKEVRQHLFRKLLIIPVVPYQNQITVSKARSASFLKWLKQV